MLAPQALRRLSVRQTEAWVVAALEGFDRTGLRAAVVRLRDIEGFARGALGHTVTLESIDARLARFLQGLSGRSLRVAVAALQKAADTTADATSTTSKTLLNVTLGGVAMQTEVIA